jgi:hypothetical protein
VGVGRRGIGERGFRVRSEFLYVFDVGLETGIECLWAWAASTLYWAYPGYFENGMHTVYTA